MERLPALKRLKFGQFWLGQAKKDNGNSGSFWASFCCGCSLAINSLLAENSYLTNNSSAKEAFLLQNLYYRMPIS
jgi:hypothetical protein